MSCRELQMATDCSVAGNWTGFLQGQKEAAGVAFACPPGEVGRAISILTCKALTAIWPSPADCTGHSWLVALLIIRPACPLPQSWQVHEAQEDSPSAYGEEMRIARLPWVLWSCESFPEAQRSGTGQGLRVAGLCCACTCKVSGAGGSVPGQLLRGGAAGGLVQEGLVLKLCEGPQQRQRPGCQQLHGPCTKRGHEALALHSSSEV